MPASLHLVLPPPPLRAPSNIHGDPGAHRQGQTESISEAALGQGPQDTPMYPPPMGRPHGMGVLSAHTKAGVPRFKCLRAE